MLNKKGVATLVYGMVMIFFLYDIIEDVVVEGGIDLSLLLEIVLFALTALLLLHEIRSRFALRAQYQQERELRRRLSGELRGFIDERFTAWGLTPSEQEVAWLLLHGYSFQEIAEVRGVKEKTVRQQATAIYAKSGSGSRAEFVALFLEDLLAAAHRSDAP